MLWVKVYVCCRKLNYTWRLENILPWDFVFATEHLPCFVTSVGLQQSVWLFKAFFVHSCEICNCFDTTTDNLHCSFPRDAQNKEWLCTSHQPGILPHDAIYAAVCNSTSFQSVVQAKFPGIWRPGPQLCKPIFSEFWCWQSISGVPKTVSTCGCCQLLCTPSGLYSQNTEQPHVWYECCSYLNLDIAWKNPALLCRLCWVLYWNVAVLLSLVGESTCLCANPRSWGVTRYDWGVILWPESSMKWPPPR